MKDKKNSIGSHEVKGVFRLGGMYLGLVVALHIPAAGTPVKSRVIEGLREATASAEGQFNEEGVMPIRLPHRLSAASDAFLDLVINVSEEATYQFVEPGVMESLQKPIEQLAQQKPEFGFKNAIPLRKAADRNNFAKLDPLRKSWQIVEFDQRRLYLEQGDHILLIVKDPAYQAQEETAA